MKAVGRVSMGRVMPHMTPKALMAEDTSAPARTSRWGMRTEVAAPIRLPSKAVQPMGRAMERIFFPRTLPSTRSPLGFRPKARR